MIKKDKVLVDIKDLILTLKDKKEELKCSEFFSLWIQKLKNIEKILIEMSIEDRREMEKLFKEWSAKLLAEVKKKEVER